MAAFTQELQQLYVAYFNRPADPRGLAYWDAAVSAAGGDLAAVSVAFAGSAEYKAAYNGLTSDQIVAKVYMNLFGRPVEPAGLAYWSLPLAQGKITVDYIVTQISAGAQGSDLAAYNAKVTAAVTFTDSINTTDEILSYSGANALVIGKAFIASVSDADTLAAAITPAALQATIDSLAVVPPPVVVPFTLTAGIDTFNGTSANDIVNNAAAGGGLTALDKIDGGTGSNTINLTDVAVIAIPASAVVKNFETANLVSALTVSGNVSGWTGLTKLTVAELGGNVAGLTAATTTAITLIDSAQGAGTITINGGSSVDVSSTGATNGAINVTGATGAVSVARTSTTNVAAGSISVTGGTTVNVAQTAANAVATTQTNGTVAVIGSAATTSVTVASSAIATASGTVAGVIANAVGVLDVNYASATDAGTIKSVTVSNFTTLTIDDNALNSLSVTGGSSNIIIDNSGLTTATNKTLALTVNGQTGGTLDDADIYTTLNVTTAGASSTFANITTGGVTALTVAGTKGLTLTSTTGLSALKTVTVSGAAGVTGDFSAGTVTSVSTAGTTGASKVTIDSAVATFTGGAGVDAVTLSNTVTGKAISLGAGNDSLVLVNTTLPTAIIDGGTGVDSLTISAATAVTQSLSAKFAAQVIGFETLIVTGGAGAQAIDLAALGGYTNVTTGAEANAGVLMLNGFGQGGTLTLNADAVGSGAYVVANSAFTAGTADSINLVLSKAGLLAAGSVTASNVETIAITTLDSQATPTNPFDTLTLVDTSLKSLTVAGNAGLNVGTIAGATALTNVDASGITAGDFTYTSAAVTAASTIKGSATGTNTIDFSLTAGKIVTYTGGTGFDNVTANNGAANDIIHLGSGTTNNTVVGGGNTGNVSVDSTATGTDMVTLGSGNNIVSLGNGANSFTATSGNNTYTGGTGVDMVTVGSGVNTITLGTGNDAVSFTANAANVNSYSTITDAHTGVTLTVTNAGTESFGTKITLASTAVFQDYANAVIQQGGNASVNGHFGWFQFTETVGGITTTNTYLVESLHDGSGVNASFVNGTDFIVKLTGVVDLSLATGGTTNILTLG
jgi:S-layer protein